MVCKKILQVTSNDISSNITFSFDPNTKKVLLVSQSETATYVLPLGEMKEQADPNVNITLIAGNGIVVEPDNSINVDTNWLDNIIDAKNFAVISAVPTGLNSWKSADNKQYISDIGFTQTSALPTKVSELDNDTGYLVSDDISGLATKDELLVNGTGLTITDGVISIDNDFLSGFVANLGYVKVEDDQVCSADEETILMTGERVLSVNTTWLDNYITDKDFVTTSALPVYTATSGVVLNGTEFSLDTAYAREQIASGYLASIPGRVQFSERLADSLGNSDVINKLSEVISGVNIDVTTGTTGGGPFTKYYTVLSTAPVPTKVSDLENDTGFITGYVDTTYTAGQGLKLDGTEFSLTAFIPSKVSDIENDTGYLVQDDLADYAKTADIPISNSGLTNDAEFITSAGVDEKLTAYLKAENYVDTTYTAGEGLKLDDTEFSLTAFIPTKVSDIENDTGFITSTSLPTKISDLTNDSEFATSAQVATIISDTSAAIIDNLATEEFVNKQVSGKADQTTVDDIASDLSTNYLKKEDETTYTAGNFIAISGDNNSVNCTLTGLSQLVNDTGFVTDDNFLEAATYVKAYPDENATGGYSEVTEDMTSAQIAKALESIYIEDDEITTGTQLINKYGNRFQRYLKLTFAVKDNQGNITDENLVFIDVNELFDGYTAGNGIAIEDNEISLTAHIPSAVSELENDTGFITGYVDTTYTAGQGLKLDGTEFSLTAFIPSKVSDIENDTGFITSTSLPTAISDLENDSEFATSAQVSGIVEGYGFITGIENNALLSDIPVIPSAVSEFENDTGFITSTSLPTKISDLTNDSEFATSAQVSGIVEGYGFITGIQNNALISDIPTAVSQLDNDAEYATSAQVSLIVEGYGFITGIENNALLSDIKTYTAGDGLALEDGEFSLTAEIPVVPTGVSAFDNDAGYLVLDDISGYAQLSDIPVVPSAVSEFENDAEYATTSYVANLVDEVSTAIPTGVSQLANDAGYLTAAPSKTSELNNDKGFVTLADLEAVKATLLDYMNPAHVASYQVIEGDINEPNKSIYIEESDVLTANTTFVGKNITVQELNSQNSYAKFTSTGDVTITNMNNDGTLVKNSTNGNGQVIINTPGRVVITDCALNQNGYNSVQIGLAAGDPPKSVLIDGVTFTGNLSNNAISIYGTADDAVVTISNCTFTKVSNVLRLSNRTNAKNVTINFVNCQFTEWEAYAAYAGIVLCQDYTNMTSADVISANLFGPDKITVNIINCTHAGTKIEFSDPATVCGSKDANQLLYVYADHGSASNGNALIAYDPEKYPTVTAI